MKKDVQTQPDTLYGMHVPETPAEGAQCDAAVRMKERGNMIDRANYGGYGQPTVEDTPDTKEDGDLD